MRKTLYVLFGFALSILTLAVLGYVPALTDFNTTYFSTNGPAVSLTSGMSKWFAMDTNNLTVGKLGVGATNSTTGSALFNAYVLGPDGTRPLPSYGFSSTPGMGMYRGGSSGILGFTSNSNQTFRLQSRTVNGDFNATLYCGNQEMISDSVNDVFTTTITGGTYNLTNAGRFVFLNIGNNVLNIADTNVTNIAGAVNIEFDKTVLQLQDTNFPVTFAKTVNTRARFIVPKTNVNVLTNIAMDVVFSGTSQDSGFIANQMAYHVPATSSQKATNIYGFYLEDTPNAGSVGTSANVDYTIRPGGTGKVGIGTATTTSLLTVGGNADLTGNLGESMNFQSFSGTFYVDANKAVVTNWVTAATTIGFATNGVNQIQKSCVVWLIGTNADQTLTINSLWRTNLATPVPPKVTNGWVVKMTCDIWGPTASSATQTNCFVKFEYYR